MIQCNSLHHILSIFKSYGNNQIELNSHRYIARYFARDIISSYYLFNFTLLFSNIRRLIKLKI